MEAVTTGWEMENTSGHRPGREKLGAEPLQRRRTVVPPEHWRRSAHLEHRGEGSMDITGPPKGGNQY